jgi:hypothetical protein
MKTLTIVGLAVLALFSGCKNRVVFLPIPYTLVASWTVQDDAGTFYEDTTVYASDIGGEAGDALALTSEDVLVDVYVESITYTFTENRVPGSSGSCYLRFKRNAGPTITLLGVTGLSLDAIIGVRTPVVPNPAGVDSLTDFLMDALMGSQDSLYIWAEGQTVPDSIDFDVDLAITFSLQKSLAFEIFDPFGS